MKSIIFFFIFYCTGQFLSAQTSFVASISPRQIYENEYATLRLVVENAPGKVDKIERPLLRDFEIVGGPSEESGMNMVNQQMVNQYLAHAYTVKPKRVGILRLEPVSAVVGGKIFKSKPIEIVVKRGKAPVQSPSNAGPLQGFFGIPDLAGEGERPEQDNRDYVLRSNENVQEKISRNMQLRLETDKKTCYLGEPVVASYNLYTRLKNDSRLVKNPSFNGFSVIDLQRPDEYSVSKKNLNGREFNVYTIRKVQLYPLQSGELALEPLSLDNNVQFIKESALPASSNAVDMLNSMSLNPNAIAHEQITLSSKPVSIVVKPLPVANKPLSFDGAVGEFEITAAVEKNNFTTTETNVLRVTLTGSGNMQLVTAPSVSWPGGIDSFDVKVTDDVDESAVPLAGNKIFDFPFSISKEGSYIIPEIEFSFFDPVKSQYKTVHSSAIPLTVVKGTASVATVAIDSGNEKISPLNRLFKNRNLVVTLIAALIIAGLIFWVRKEKQAEETETESRRVQEEAARVRLEQQIAENKNPLQESADNLHQTDSQVFISILNRELKNFLAEKFQVELTGISAAKILAAMDKKGVANEAMLETGSLLKDMEFQLYTPSLVEESKMTLYNRSLQLVNTLQSTATVS